MEKAVLYVRISSEDKKYGYSLDAQEKLGYEYASRNKLSIIKKWRVTESAWKKDRIAFNQLVDYAKAHPEVKHVIFDIVDRMTRNDFDKLKIYQLLKENDKVIHFSRTCRVIDKNISTDDEFLMDIEVAAAKRQSNDTSRKAKMGMQERAAQGTFPSYAPIGYVNYTVSKINGKDIKDIKPDPERALFIKKIFEWYASGNYSTDLIANKAYEEGLRSRGTKGGDKVAKSSIHKILNNPAYYGEFDFDNKRYVGNYTPIISKELFDKVQNKLNGYNKFKQVKRSFAFAGLIKCNQCNCAVTAEIKKNKYIYYHCTGYRGNCGNDYIREEKLSDRLSPIIKAIHIEKEEVELIKNALLDSNEKEIKYINQRKGILEGQKTKLESRLEKAIEEKLDGKISEEDYNRLAPKWNLELQQIETQLKNHGNNDIDWITKGEYILELCNRAHDLYLRQTPQEQAKLLHVVLSNCKMDCSNDVSLYPTYRKPFDIFAKGLSRSNWLPGLDSNQRPNGYTLTHITVRVGLYLYRILLELR